MKRKQLKGMIATALSILMISASMPTNVKAVEVNASDPSITTEELTEKKNEILTDNLDLEQEDMEEIESFGAAVQSAEG